MNELLPILLMAISLMGVFFPRIAILNTIVEAISANVPKVPLHTSEYRRVKDLLPGCH